MTCAPDLQSDLDAFDRASPERTSLLVDRVLTDALQRSASDIHFEPTPRSVEVRYRLDGVLQPAAILDRELAPNLVARLKVLAELLTYRLDIPQEGGMREALARYGADMRVSTFPTIHGEKAVVRIFETSGQMLDLEQLGLAEDVTGPLGALLRERGGALLLTGPSGSGKTTTIYACLRHLVRADAGGRSIVTIEDPVEQVIEGVSQAQARPGSEFDFARGLRSLLRQDPEVIMIGEVRDRETAAIAVEAALTGHLVISTLHAGSAWFSRPLSGRGAAHDAELRQAVLARGYRRSGEGGRPRRADDVTGHRCVARGDGPYQRRGSRAHRGACVE